jgi:hypothetical protein
MFIGAFSEMSSCHLWRLLWGDMQTSTIIAALVAPTVGGLFWWLVQRPGKFISDTLWKRLPEGRLRRLLLRRVS